MEEKIERLHFILQKLIGLHRQLLDTVRAERESLVQADLNQIHAVTSTKQALVESIHQVEIERQKCTGELAFLWKKPYSSLSLPNIIVHIQATDPKAAEHLRTNFNALTVLIQRISEQNADNRGLIEKSLEHIHMMKKNILGEASPHSSTYTQQGQRSSNHSNSRLISKEA